MEAKSTLILFEKFFSWEETGDYLIRNTNPDIMMISKLLDLNFYLFTGLSEETLFTATAIWNGFGNAFLAQKTTSL